MVTATNQQIQITTMKIKDLKPAKYNPRKISKKEITKLKQSIQEYGLVQNIVVNKDYTIIGGHQRVQACAELGIMEVPVMILDLPEDKEKALNIALNKISGQFDESALAELLKELEETQGDLVTGYDNDELARLFFKQNNQINRSLIEDYIIPPFSIFDSKQGYWQKRKKEWIEKIGDSGEGRDDALLGEGLKSLAVKSGGGSLTGTSIFDPVLTEVLYTWFCKPGGLIIDPFAGGNTRGLIASILEYSYIGTDLNLEQLKANRKKAEALHEKNVNWVHDNGLNLNKHVKEKADMLITCPPYYDLEVYTDNPDDISNAGTYEEFREVYDEILGRTYDLLKEGAFAIVVVGNVRDKNGNYYNLVGDTVTAMQKAGYKFYNEIILATSIATASVRARQTFDKNKKVVKTHQNILFFHKGQKVAVSGKLKDIVQTGITATAHHDVLVFKK